MTYPDFLTSEGEQPFYTEFFIKTETEYKEKNGKTMLETVLSDEFDGYPEMYTEMPKHLAEIVDRADRIYGGYEIGAETEEMFMALLIRKTARICPMWEHRFKAYSKMSDEDVMDTDLSVAGKGKTTYKDVPDTDGSGGFVTNITETENETKQTEGTTLDAMNRNMERYRYLVLEFVNEYGDLFMDTSAHFR